MELLARDVVTRALKVPDKYRNFSVSPAGAHRVYGISEALLSMLLDLGLPCAGVAEDAAFDPLDLENTASALGLPSSQMAVMHLWARSLARAKALQRECCEITLSLNCPEPGHAGDCDFSLSCHLAAALGGPERPEGDHVVARVVMPSEIYDFEAPFDVVAKAAQRLVFHRIPEELGCDLGFLKETQLADCRSASRYLSQVAADVGYASRPASGFFIGAPFPCTHAWFDIRVDDRWTAADPFFLNTLHRWNILTPEDWPVTRSPQNIVWPLEEAHELTMPLVRHGNTPVKAVVAARWL
ncbi:hypothetical protein [Streptomyces sp. S.PNR 29]|uniref:hypothetical protein n=1 Tax=Streptomyces sp. S.PNR 29 TaxID=2973805 RepID=UPI0025AED376|nr:hypothetical protein [Streptomyces sp. S.PNR 29]MDN0197619.1 hypothetical protein [Streptomyces sp. S.PNR 29]